MKKLKILEIGYVLLVIGLFLYSYTQVDLNLTLSRISFWQTIEKAFQYVGWFQRPLSTTLYLTIITLLFVFYLAFLRRAKEGKFAEKQFWQLTITISVILLFSYNAFSYDLFNYMFDARIVTYHGQNPYEHKALDYPGDPWINFMRWTHRTYPYGPVWLGLTIPLSFIGFQFFLPTLFLYKGLMTAGYLGTVYVLGKILERTSPSKKLLGMTFFAYNPLVVIEGLVSAHNDIVMIFLSILGIYLLLDKKTIRSLLVFVASIGIKFSTVLLIPVYLFLLMPFLRKKLSLQTIWTGGVVLMLVAVLVLLIRTEFQPWYLLLVLPFVALHMGRFLLSIFIPLSLGLLLHYAPFLYMGNWDPPIPAIRLYLTASSIVIGFLVYGLMLAFGRKHTV